MAASSLSVRTERSYRLPDGSAGTNDVAAPGRSAHHPGITPEGVICTDRDNSPVGRGARVAGPCVPASRVDPHRGRGARGSSRPASSSAWPSSSSSMAGPAGDGPRSFSRMDGQPAPGSSGLSTPVRKTAVPSNQQHARDVARISAPGVSPGALRASGIYGPVWIRGIRPFSGGSSGRCRRLLGQISPRASPSRTASARELTSSLR